jgi:hypothetical protein
MLWARLPACLPTQGSTLKIEADGLEFAWSGSKSGLVRGCAGCPQPCLPASAGPPGGSA